MFNLFTKGRFSALLALISLGGVASPLMAEHYYDPCASDRFYIGAFGGGIYSNSNQAHQYGTAFFSELTSIGPLSIIADGNLDKASSGFGGVQIGYEWSNPRWSNPECYDWSLAPAIELEALFFSYKKQGHLVNRTLTGLDDEHDFFDTFRSSSTVILASGVLTLDNNCLFGLSPYVGGGIGGARVSLYKADSLQIDPPEAGFNHFNSQRDDSSWAFAAQIKAGLRYNLFQMFHIFAEYRYLYIDATNYIFGATNYTNHVPTSAWNVKVKNIHSNAFSIGFQYDL